jgi:hypothetical protein
MKKYAVAPILPYLKIKEQAIDLIERYLDELPDPSFSDRPRGGDRAKVVPRPRRQRRIAAGRPCFSRRR